MIHNKNLLMGSRTVMGILSKGNPMGSPREGGAS